MCVSVRWYNWYYIFPAWSSWFLFCIINTRHLRAADVVLTPPANQKAPLRSLIFHSPLVHLQGAQKPWAHEPSIMSEKAIICNLTSAPPSHPPELFNRLPWNYKPDFVISCFTTICLNTNWCVFFPVNPVYSCEMMMRPGWPKTFNVQLQKVSWQNHKGNFVVFMYCVFCLCTCWRWHVFPSFLNTL